MLFSSFSYVTFVTSICEITYVPRGFRTDDPNQKCMYGAALAISGNHCLYLVIFGIPLEPYYFELVIIGVR